MFFFLFHCADLRDGTWRNKSHLANLFEKGPTQRSSFLSSIPPKGQHISVPGVLTCAER